VSTTRRELEQLGFLGFVRFADLPASDVPTSAGVYAVIREASEPPEFREVSPAGRFKDRNPTVPVAELAAAWVPGVQTVYLGKAGPGATGRRGLRKRLTEYRLFGGGRPIGHWGGRYVWQLTDADELLVAWLPTPTEDPTNLEGELIATFVAATGRLPFANHNRGRSPAQ
jgi:hypothetical protein